MSAKQSTTLDVELGTRITLIRKAKGVTQTELGKAIGVSFQQVQKYEKGQNRIGASRLNMVAKFLEVSIADLYKKEADTGEERSELFDFLHHPGAVELAKIFAEIDDPQLRRDVLALVRTIARVKPKPVVGGA